MATSRWRDWQPGQWPKNIQKQDAYRPAKPTKPGFDGFDGAPLGPSQIFFPDSVDQDIIDQAGRLLNEVEARLWIDSEGRAYVGVWECVDTEAVRRAASLLFPSARILHLERPEVPARLKGMSRKIASIQDRK
jgi:hypothetical protein